MKFYQRNAYDAYSKVYDALKGDRTENIRRVKALIEEYQPNAKIVLEIACGTGSIIQGLVDSYSIVGLDNSVSMLRIAKEKLPGVRFITSTMVNFNIDKRFDVIYCVHNSVNHLLSFQEWEEMFDSVAAHLHRGGIFLFDINPVEKMEALTKLGSDAYEAADHFVVTKVTRDPKRPEQYHWNVDIFMHQRRHKFVLHSSVINVSAYPVERIAGTLARHFNILENFTLQEAEKFDDIGRMYFVCAKA